jgi:enoyl-CoA hydratase/carnithine racemase
MPALTDHDGFHLFDLGADENRFTSEWLDAAEAALDRVVASPAPLITIGTGKFFSNGLDLDWILANPDAFGPYVERVEALLGRFLTLPVPTVAAVSGHAFGAGAMVALAHDWRIMRSDRGYLCLPEVDIRVPFTPGMSALVQSKLTARAAVDAMTTGMRFTGPTALASGLVDDLAPEDGLLDAAAARLASLRDKDPATLGTIKSTMFAEASRLLNREN